MRWVLTVLLIGITAAAQEDEPPASTIHAVEPSTPPSTTPPGTLPPPPTLPPLTIPEHPYFWEQAKSRWTGARVLYGFGGAFGLVGTGLSLSSAIYILATDYPPSAKDFNHPAKASDPQQALAYAGSASSAFGFALEAAGLGWQHLILRDLHADPGRGLFISGNVIGLVGFVAIGTSYFIGLTDYLNPHDQGVAVLAASLTGSALCTIAGLFFVADSARMRRAWERLTHF